MLSSGHPFQVHLDLNGGGYLPILRYEIPLACANERLVPSLFAFASAPKIIIQKPTYSQIGPEQIPGMRTTILGLDFWGSYCSRYKRAIFAKCVAIHSAKVPTWTATGLAKIAQVVET